MYAILDLDLFRPHQTTVHLDGIGVTGIITVVFDLDNIACHALSPVLIKSMIFTQSLSRPKKKGLLRSLSALRAWSAGGVCFPLWACFMPALDPLILSMPPPSSASRNIPFETIETDRLVVHSSSSVVVVIVVVVVVVALPNVLLLVTRCCSRAKLVLNDIFVNCLVVVVLINASSKG